MIFDLIKKNKTLQELTIGIALFGIICEILLLVFTQRKLYYSIGLLIGVIISELCAIHMAWGIEIAVMLDEKGSIAYTRKYTVIRYVIMCVALVVVGVIDFGSPVTLILGYMSLKMGAYLNPFIHKILNKNPEGETQDESNNSCD